MKAKNAIVINGVVYRLRRTNENYFENQCDACLLKRRCSKTDTMPCFLFPQIIGKVNYFDIEPFDYERKEK